MALLIHSDPQSGVLRMEGTFTFEGHGLFKAATAGILEAGSTPAVILDLSGVTYLDSAALGMLLLLRERAGAKGMKVVLHRPAPTVLTILQVVQFGRLFEIREA